MHKKACEMNGQFTLRSRGKKVYKISIKTIGFLYELCRNNRITDSKFFGAEL